MTSEPLEVRVLAVTPEQMSLPINDLKGDAMNLTLTEINQTR